MLVVILYIDYFSWILLITMTEHDGLIQGICQLTLLGLFWIHDWDYTVFEMTLDCYTTGLTPVNNSP